MLLELALARPPAERAVFLEGACLGDPALRQRLEALLQAHAAAGAPLSPPPQSTIKIEPPPPDEALGKNIGPYKLLEKIGEGGFGAVYVAEQREPVKRRVALKIIKLGMDTKQVIARFEAERQALAMMDHPNIARALDAGATENGRPYFVMELVRGVQITDYCDQANLPTSERLELFIKVCQAIQHAHQKGVIHRDIKPSNILVTLHDSVPAPKVIDFGIAKATEGRLTDATVYTQLQQFVGTPAYMSPEQAEMSGLDIDTRSDIYSLGVLLYELLAGSPPFDPDDLMSHGIDAMRKTIREKEPVKPSTRFATLQGEELTTTARRRSADIAKLKRQLKGDLDWIVMKCLEKDRARRYETANGLAADIQRHLANELVVARPPGVGYKIQKFVRRNRAAVLAASLVLLALVAGVIGTTWALLDALKQKREAQRERIEADRQGKIARHTTDFLTGMFEDIDQGQATLRDITVREVLDQASGKISAAFPGDPLTELPIRRTFVDVYSKLGKPYSALTNAEAALALAKLAYGGQDSEATANCLDDLANSLDAAARSPEALAIHQQALAMQRRLHRGDDLNVAKAIFDLATGQVDLDQPAQAVTNFQAALAMFQRLSPGDNPHIADCLYSIANCYLHLGRTTEALTNFQATLAVFRQIYPGDFPDTATCQSAVAQCQEKLGRYTEALTNYAASLAMSQHYFHGDHPNVGDGLSHLAHCQVNLGLYADALTNNQAAWAMFQRIYQGDNQRVASSQANIALCQTHLGLYADALPNRQASLAMFERLHPGDSPDVALDLDLLADCQNGLGLYAEAAANFQAGLSMAQKLDCWDDLLLGRERNRFGDCLDYLGRPDDARQRYTEALAAFQRAATNQLTEKTGELGVANSHLKLGDVLAELRDGDDSVSHYRAALEAAEAVLTIDPANAEATALRATCRAKLALEKVEVVVHQVYPRSQAMAAGLKPGDVVVSYDGKQMLCSSDLPLLTARATGPAIQLEIRRDGAPHQFTFQPGPLGILCRDRSIVGGN